LRALAEHLSRVQNSEFGDWELERAGPLAELFPPEEADILSVVEPDFLVFAGDFAGGLLALDVGGAGDVERAPVVAFDSEAGMNLLGETFDDFLALIAGEHPDPLEDAWTADDELRQWIVSTGVAPHRSAGERLTELAPLTRAFRARFAAALREASRRVRPAEALDLALVVGERIGDVSLGMPQAELDARWGAPETPEWGRHDGRFMAIYGGQPLAIEFDADSRRVSRVTLFAGRHRAVATDGTDPMFLTSEEAIAWLSASGFSVEATAEEILVPSERLRLALAVSRGGHDVVPWVEAIELAQP
jgi:hypothetical protein